MNLRIVDGGELNLDNVTLVADDFTIDSNANFSSIDSPNSIWINYNWTINGFANLTNTTVRLNGSTDGYVGVTVNPTGWMVVNGSSNITNGDTSSANYFFIVKDGSNFSMDNSYLSNAGWMIINETSNITNGDVDTAEYYFTVQNGSNFSMDNSYLSECGWGASVGQLGLEINTTVDSFTNNIISNNNFGLYIYSSDNFIDNVTVTGSGYGIYLNDGDNNTLNNINSSDHTSYGLYIYQNSHGHTITNSVFNSNDYGILIRSDNNSFENIETNSNNHQGIWFSGGENNSVDNLIAMSNEYGVLLFGGEYNTVSNSYIGENSLAGIYFPNGTSVAENYYFYNNIINNSLNLQNENDSVRTNYFNTSGQSATNIIGGQYIGGNYWTNSTNNGYSDVCVDVVYPYGICDNYLNMTNGTSIAIDYLPLSNFTGPPPYIFSVNITDSVAYTNTNVNCKFNITGSGSIYANLTWFLDDEIVYEESGINCTSNLDCFANLPWNRTNYDKTVVCSVNANNSNGWSGWSNSTDLIISNYSTSLTLDNGTNPQIPNMEMIIYANYSSDLMPVSGLEIRNYEIAPLIWNTTDLSTSDEAYFMENVDCEKKGAKDCIIIGSDNLYMYYGNGTLYWEVDTLTNKVTSLQAGDFDNNGYGDIIINDGNFGCSGGSYGTRLYSFYGTPINDYAPSGAYCGHKSAKLGDFDGQGIKNDFVIEDLRGHIWIYNSTDGYTWSELWNNTNSVTQGNNGIVVDANNDGIDDVVVMHASIAHNYTTFSGNNGTVLFESTEPNPNGGYPVLFRDFNGDSYLDYFAGGFQTFRTMYHNGTVNESVSSGIGDSVHAMRLIDIDEDGVQDEFLFATTTAYDVGPLLIQVYNETADFQYSYAVTEGSADGFMGDIVVADFNDDGINEIISGDSDQTVDIFSKSGQFIKEIMINSGTVRDIDVFDINRDGINEIATLSQNGIVNVFQQVNCTVRFNDSTIYNMTWVEEEKKWGTNKTFPSVGTYNYNVTCHKAGYESEFIESSVTIDYVETQLDVENITASVEVDKQVHFYANYSTTTLPVSGLGLTEYDIGRVIWNRTASQNVVEIDNFDFDSDGRRNEFLTADTAWAGGITAYYGNGTMITSGNWPMQGSNYESSIDYALQNGAYYTDWMLYEDSQIRIYDQMGVSKWNSSTIDGINRVIIGDYDGDGYNDDWFTVYSFSGNWRAGVYIENSGTWSSAWNFTSAVRPNSWTNTPSEMISGDINGDGIEEILLIHAGVNYVYLFNGNNGSVMMEDNGSFETMYSGIFGDIDNDGNMEIFIGERYEIYGYEWNGSYGYNISTTNADYLFTEPAQVVGSLDLVDVNDDGKDDIVCTDAVWNGATANVMAFDYLNNSLWSSPITTDGADTLNYMEFTVHDFNNDGYKEIMFQENDFNYVYLLNRTGEVIWKENAYGGAIIPNADSKDLVIADFNNDGLDDVVIASQTNQLYLIQDVMCTADFDDLTSVNMTWNNTIRKWEGNKSFTNPGINDYNVTCFKGGYKTSLNSSSVLVRQKIYNSCTVGAFSDLEINQQIFCNDTNITAMNLRIVDGGELNLDNVTLVADDFTIACKTNSILIVS